MSIRGGALMSRSFLLGSSSATRKLILSEAGYQYTVFKADLDERAIGDRSCGSYDKATELVLLLGNAKADNILQKLPLSLKEQNPILITGDQVVTYNGVILEKPNDVNEARSFIESYGTTNTPCSTVGSIVVTDINTGIRKEGVDIANIYFKKFSKDVVDALIEEGEVMWCAGALMIEHKLVQPFIDKVDGNIDSVMGLSIDLLKKLLHELDEELQAKS
jgi:septum formation protein